MADLIASEDYSRQEQRVVGEPVLRIDGVVKRFGDNVVLNHISFDVRTVSYTHLTLPTTPYV